MIYSETIFEHEKTDPIFCLKTRSEVMQILIKETRWRECLERSILKTWKPKNLPLNVSH